METVLFSCDLAPWLNIRFYLTQYACIGHTRDPDGIVDGIILLTNVDVTAFNRSEKSSLPWPTQPFFAQVCYYCTCAIP